MVSVKPLNAALGAQIEGVDLSADLDSQLQTRIRDAFHEHIVLLFRDQDLDAAAQVRFTEIFGEVKAHPLKTRRNVDGFPGVLIIENQPSKPGARNDYWHSDISHAERPPLGSILHAKVVPDGKGDTMFCNMTRAFETLSPGMQRLFDGMRAWHSGAATQRRNAENNDGLDVKDVPPPRLQPVVRVHPETGRKALFVNSHFVTHFEDMTVAESRPLMDLIEAHSTVPENVYRHRWQPGDVLMWDNRASMHYAVRDYGPDDRRLMHRTTAAGEVPQ